MSATVTPAVTPAVKRTHQMDGNLRLSCFSCGWSRVVSPRRRVERDRPGQLLWRALAAGHECVTCTCPGVPRHHPSCPARWSA